MKKALIFTLVFMLAAVANMSAVMAANVDTSLTQVQAGGDAPMVEVKWEMNPTKVDGKYLGTDDSEEAGAQFNPTGVKDRNRTIAICAIVSDTDGVADIDGVYADVFYPEGIALGEHHTALPLQSGEGCGAFMQQDTMTELSKEEGIDLFCNKIRNNNANLPTFHESKKASKWYEDICAQDGEFLKLKAEVYCVEKDLSYEDPSGHYKVEAVAQDTNSLTGTLSNTFEYLPLTAFQADFTSVNYGNVKLNIEKIVNGNLNFKKNDDMPTVRNVGNTRMNLTVWQDDMNLGSSSGAWNVNYKARVGSYVDYQPFEPEQTITLDDALDLSQTDEVDFSILVNKFPTSGSTNWAGNMVLGAVTAPHLTCPKFVKTQDSGQNATNEGAGHPYISYVIDGLCIDFTFVNPTPHNFVFDYRVDGETGFNGPYHDVLIHEGELVGQLIGKSYNRVEFVGPDQQTARVCGQDEIWVGMREGAEQSWYLDWLKFEVQ